MSKDPRTNPELEQRLKENAVTMNKMMELRTQLENLSMTKKVKYFEKSYFSFVLIYWMDLVM